MSEREDAIYELGDRLICLLCDDPLRLTLGEIDELLVKLRSTLHRAVRDVTSNGGLH